MSDWLWLSAMFLMGAVGFQLGAGWVIDRGYGPFLWGFTHPFGGRRNRAGVDLERILDEAERRNDR